jgi:hypothetical protein
MSSETVRVSVHDHETIHEIAPPRKLERRFDGTALGIPKAHEQESQKVNRPKQTPVPETKSRLAGVSEQQRGCINEQQKNQGRKDKTQSFARHELVHEKVESRCREQDGELLSTLNECSKSTSQERRNQNENK